MQNRLLNSSEIITESKNGSLAFVTGAGISFPAGIPLVGKIADILLEELELYDFVLGGNRDNNTFRDNLWDEFISLQFESIVTTLLGKLDLTKKHFFNVFDASKNNYQPAIAHIVLAYLAHLGKISTIATFNIDQLHEIAFEKVFNHFGSDKTLKIYNSTDKHSLNSYDKVDWLNQNEVRLLKWHGDVKYREELGMTIEQIAGQKQQDSRINSMKRFYGGVPVTTNLSKTNKNILVLHNTIGVIGSEVGNNFDENIVLNDLDKSLQKVFMIYHRNDDISDLRRLNNTQNIRSKSIEKEEVNFNPFKVFHKNSIWEHIATERVLDSFYPMMIEKPKFLSDKTAQKTIKDWIKKQPNTLRYLAASELLRKMGYTKEALISAELAEKKCSVELLSYTNPLVVSYEMQASLLHLFGDLDKAKKKLNKALRIYNKKNDPIGKSKTLNDLANIDITEGNYKAAERKYLYAIKEYNRNLENNTFLMGKAVASTNLAFVYRQLGDFDKVKSQNNTAEKIFNKLGKIGELAIMNNSQGRMALLKGDLSIANSLFESAEKLGKKWGKITAVAESYNGRGMICQHQGDSDLANELFSKAIEYYRKANDVVGINASRTHLANILRSEGKYKQALKEYKKIEKNSFSSIARFTAINNQGTIHHAWYQATKDYKHLDKSMRFYNIIIKAAKRQKGSVNSEILVNAYINRSVVYIEKSHNNKAKKDLLKAQNIAELNEYTETLGNILINFGTLEQNNKNFKESIRYYKKALNYPLNGESTSVVFNNLGLSFENLGNSNEALTNYQSAIKLGEKGKLYGLLKDYYANAAFVSKKLANKVLAVKYARKAYSSAKKTEIPNIDGYKELINIINS